MRLTVLALIIASFEEPWSALINASWKNAAITWIVASGVAGTALWISVGTEKMKLLGVGIAISAGAVGGAANCESENGAILFQIADNIALIALGIGLIAHGTGRRIARYYYSGVGIILITGLLRYIDLIGSYAGSAGLFTVLSTIMLGTGWYWKKMRGQV